MRRLSKEESRQRWAELRDLWNQYDPIGVMGYPNSPKDEYDSYVGWTMRCLEQNVSLNDIVDNIEEIVREGMGLSHFDRNEANLYAQRMIDWYRDKWEGTYV